MCECVCVRLDKPSRRVGEGSLVSRPFFINIGLFNDGFEDELRALRKAVSVAQNRSSPMISVALAWVRNDTARVRRCQRPGVNYGELTVQYSAS